MTSRDIDMSPDALGRRLEEIRALYRLMMHLRQARLVGPVAPTR